MLEGICNLKYPIDSLKFFYFILFTPWKWWRGKNRKSGLNNVQVIEEYLKESSLMKF